MTSSHQKLIKISFSIFILALSSQGCMQSSTQSGNPNDMEIIDMESIDQEGMNQMDISSVDMEEEDECLDPDDACPPYYRSTIRSCAEVRDDDNSCEGVTCMEITFIACNTRLEKTLACYQRNSDDDGGCDDFCEPDFVCLGASSSSTPCQDFEDDEECYSECEVFCRPSGADLCDHDDPTCPEGYDLSDQACEEGEEECVEATLTCRDEPMYCRPSCPPPVCPSMMEMCYSSESPNTEENPTETDTEENPTETDTEENPTETENEENSMENEIQNEDETCTSILVGEGRCESEIFCKPIEMDCLETLQCNEDEMEVDLCPEQDPTCRVVEGCDRLVYCQKNQSSCMETPQCPTDQHASEFPCLRGDEDCTVVETCGSVLHCRPNAQCYAIGVCAEDEYGTPFACEEGEEGQCSNQSLCGEMLFCRTQALCLAVPICNETEVQSDQACLATESVESCRAVSECGSTIICRSEE